MSKLVGIKTYERFRSLWENDNIDELSLNFILDTGQIYTHGIFINSAVFGTAANGAVSLSIAGTTNTLALSSHTHSNYYDKSEDLDITNHKIVSGLNDLLFCSGGTLYLGNTDNPTYISGSALYSTRGENSYTILDTGNFEITNTLPSGYTHNNTAYIKYGSSSHQIDYVKRINTSLSFDYLHGYTLAGTNQLNGIYYGYINFTVDNVYNNPAWAQLRINISSKTVQYRTSADANNWIDLSTPTIPLNALNTAGIVSAPTSANANKVWKTDNEGNPSWRDEKSYTFNNLAFQQISGTDLMTYNTSTAKTILAGDNIAFSYENDVLTIRALDTTYSAFTGASQSENGATGLVTLPLAGDQNKYLRGDGTWQDIVSNLTASLMVGASNGTATEALSTNGNVHLIFKLGTSYKRYKIQGTGRASVTSDANGHITINSNGYSNFGTATDTTAGTAGLVPAPSANQLGSLHYFLCADGTWDVPPNAWNEANTNQDGYIPQLVTGGTAISGQSTDYVLTYVSTETGVVTPRWKLLPTNAFNDTWNAASFTLAGYVPQSIKGKYLHANVDTGDLEWVDDRDTTYDVFTGASASEDGTSGLVTAPTVGNQDKFLKGNGTWDTPTNTWRNIYVGNDQKMTTANNSKALNIVAGTNISLAYAAPGTGANQSGSTLYGTLTITATDTWTAWAGADASNNGTAGYMPAPTSALKDLFLRGDGQWVALNNYSLPTATNTKLGGVKVGTTLTNDSGYIKVHIKDGFIYYKDTNTWDALSSTKDGYVPKAADGVDSSSSNTYYFLGYTGTTVNWYKLPANAFNNNTYSDFTGSGTGHAHGLVPDPGATAGTTKYLREDGTWWTPPNDNTWDSCTTSRAGYVPKAIAGKFLHCDNSGNLEWINDNNSHYSAVPVLGGSTATTNATSDTANNATYLNIVENSTKSGGILIIGSGGTSVKANGGVLTISSTSADTTTTLTRTAGNLEKDTWSDVGTFADTVAEGTWVMSFTIDGSIYSGIFSRKKSDTMEEEINLHAAGTSSKRIYAKTIGNKIQIVTADETFNPGAVTFNFRKLL